MQPLATTAVNQVRSVRRAFLKWNRPGRIDVRPVAVIVEQIGMLTAAHLANKWVADISSPFEPINWRKHLCGLAHAMTTREPSRPT